jgi:2-methylcitrate dehydratase PrpD
MTAAGTKPAAGVTAGLAAWVAGLTLGDVPPRVAERAKHLLLDGVAAGLAGAQLPWSRVAADAVLSIEGAGPAAVMGTGRTTSGPAAVLLNSTFIQGFELDDFHPIAPLHSASLILPVLLASGAAAGAASGAGSSAATGAGAAAATGGASGAATGADALTAAVAGFETGPRVGRALHGAQMLSRGWHSGPVFGTHAAAMAAGKLRGLDAAQLEDALGLAATQSAGLMAAQYEAMSKRMQHGFAARNGFYAAGLAAAGYTGIKAVFEREYGGFLAVFGEGHDPVPAEITAQLGQRWETELIMVKSYAAQGGLHGVIEAALALRAEHDLDPAAIEKIDIGVGDAVYRHGWWPPQRPLTPTGAQMNLGYAVAVALLDGDVLPPQFSAARLDADDVWDLIGRVSVRLDEGIERGPAAERFSTDLKIIFPNGSELTKRVIQPHGAPADPVTNDEIVAKYRRLTGTVLPAARRDAIEQAVLHLEQAGDLGNLTDLLAPAVPGVMD